MDKCCEAGLKPFEVWRCTLGEIFSTINGYEKRLYQYWNATRFLSYTMYQLVTKPADRENIYDYMPLEGDPTPEERKFMELQEQKRAEEQALHDIALYKQFGYIT